MGERIKVEAPSHCTSAPDGSVIPIRSRTQSHHGNWFSGNGRDPYWECPNGVVDCVLSCGGR
jgi:hypothetical protein